MSAEYSTFPLRQPFLKSIISEKHDLRTIEDQIIDGCIANDRRAQKALFERYSPTMMGICVRYSKSSEEAQDIMQDGFIKVFTHIETFRRQGSFEGWIKRIMVNTALNYYHKTAKNRHQNIDEITETKILDTDEPHKKLPFTQVEMLEAIRSLPEGYGVVFNLYVFEKYKHREISDLLDISVNTSKSQLSKARTYLQKELVKIERRRTK